MRRSRGGRFGIIEGGSGEIWRAQRADFEGGSVGMRGWRTGSGSETPAPWVRGLSRGWWCEGGDRVAKDYRLPLSRISWHAFATEAVESGSFASSFAKATEDWLFLTARPHSIWGCAEAGCCRIAKS